MTQFALTHLPAPPVARQIGAAVHRTSLLSAEGLMERMFSRLFHGLVYPQIWEDPAVDMAALAIRPGDRLVAIASGGCNVLSYLTQGPGSILAVDLSPAHVALGRLKLAAARTLPDHAAFFDLFGRADLPGNAALYDRHIAPALDGRSRRYWEARSPFGRRIQLFERGFYRHGALGRFIGAAHTLARAAGTDLRGFLDCPDIEAQRSFFYAHIGPLFEAPVVQALARRPAALFGLGIPPAQYALLAGDGDGDVLPVLRQRLHRLLCDFPPARELLRLPGHRPPLSAARRGRAAALSRTHRLRDAARERGPGADREPQPDRGARGRTRGEHPRLHPCSMRRTG